MADIDSELLDGTAREDGFAGESVGRIAIEDNASGSSIRDSLLAALRSDHGSGESERTDSNVDSGTAKKRGRPRGSKNGQGKAVEIESPQSALVADGIKGNVSGVLKTFGHSMARMYAPYGDFWEYDKTELQITGQLTENIAKQTVGSVDNLSLKSSIIALTAVVGIGLVVRSFQTYQLTQAIKKLQAQTAQQPTYQARDNPNVAQSYPTGQPPADIHEYADLMADTLAQSPNGLP